jgi:hypothetical protein
MGGRKSRLAGRLLAGTNQLQARFNANAFSGRLESGYRLVSPFVDIGITPYAAAQVIQGSRSCRIATLLFAVTRD